MASLREIKQRISSVRNTLKITSAMKMVSSAKLFKAQQAIAGNVPYEKQLHGMLDRLLMDKKANECFHRLPQAGASNENKEKGSVTLVLFSSDSSLCGSFNMNVIRKFQESLHELHLEGYSDDDIEIYTVGKRIAEAVRRMGLTITREWVGSKTRTEYEKAVEIYDTLTADFEMGKTRRILLVYGHFHSTGHQYPKVDTYLPLEHTQAQGVEDLDTDFILEPDVQALVSSLVPKVMLLKIYTVILDANAAEHAARTMAMQIASDNAEDLLGELTLSYNKTRQQAITNEILDIVGGSLQ